MRQRVVAAIMILSVLNAFSTALGQSQPNAVVALHDQPSTNNSGCSSSPNSTSLPCTQYDTDNRPTGSDRFVYLVVAKADPTPGIAGAVFGISYTDNIDVYAWSLCATLEFRSSGWPASGSGNLITWNAAGNCQQTVIGSDGVHAIAGFFSVFAHGDGTIEVTPRPIDGSFQVADCSAVETNVTVAGGKVGYGSEVGFNPCLNNPIAVEKTTWSAVKKYFLE